MTWGATSPASPLAIRRVFWSFLPRSGSHSLDPEECRPPTTQTWQWKISLSGWWFGQWLIVILMMINDYILTYYNYESLLIINKPPTSWLVVWNIWIIFHSIYGMSSFPLMNSCFPSFCKMGTLHQQSDYKWWSFQWELGYTDPKDSWLKPGCFFSVSPLENDLQLPHPMTDPWCWYIC